MPMRMYMAGHRGNPRAAAMPDRLRLLRSTRQVRRRRG